MDGLNGAEGNWCWKVAIFLLAAKVKVEEKAFTL